MCATSSAFHLWRSKPQKHEQIRCLIVTKLHQSCKADDLIEVWAYKPVTTGLTMQQDKLRSAWLAIWLHWSLLKSCSKSTTSTTSTLAPFNEHRVLELLARKSSFDPFAGHRRVNFPLLHAEVVKFCINFTWVDRISHSQWQSIKFPTFVVGLVALITHNQHSPARKWQKLSSVEILHRARHFSAHFKRALH